jgi:hypothetical protein
MIHFYLIIELKTFESTNLNYVGRILPWNLRFTISYIVS